MRASQLNVMVTPLLTILSEMTMDAEKCCWSEETIWFFLHPIFGKIVTTSKEMGMNKH